MARTKIEWCARPGTIPMSWSPVTGCTPISAGCKFCWAKRMSRRLAGRHGYPEYPHHFDVTLRPDRLEIPLRWKKPRTVFVCSMSDLFHEDIPDYFIWYVWWEMAKAKQHSFQVLTKRPERMRSLVKQFVETESPGLLSNVWLGVTAENQAAADERRSDFEAIPAAVKFISYEPALRPIDWAGWEFVDQIISGGESGPGARPSHPDWHRTTRDFCQSNGIAYFFKQWGEWIPERQYLESAIDYKWGTLDDEGAWFPLTTPWNGRQGDASPEREYIMLRVGKKRAGRLLDGKAWDEFPVMPCGHPESVIRGNGITRCEKKGAE